MAQTSWPLLVVAKFWWDSVEAPPGALVGIKCAAEMASQQLTTPLGAVVDPQLTAA